MEKKIRNGIIGGLSTFFAVILLSTKMKVESKLFNNLIIVVGMLIIVGAITLALRRKALVFYITLGIGLALTSYFILYVMWEPESKISIFLFSVALLSSLIFLTIAVVRFVKTILKK